MIRLIVEEAISRTIVDRDLEVKDLRFAASLSGPCRIEFTHTFKGPGYDPVILEPWKHLIHVEKNINGVRKIIGTGIVQPSEKDDKGDYQIKAEGFSNYPVKIPWLQNWNPVVVDPFEVVHKIWDHVQSYPQGNLGVVVYPESSGTFLLPGYSFDGASLNIDFFAMFIRSADFRDCGDEVNALARDIPFDYLEHSEWNGSRTAVNKKIELSYPSRGVERTGMILRFGENVISGKPKATPEIDYASDIIVKGWFPGKVYSSTFSNAEVDRLRRVVRHDDVFVNSKERAAVWAKRKLARRQTPPHWETLTISESHPNAPFGQWELGDTIQAEGYMPWVGRVKAPHRIMGYSIDDKGSGTVELTLKHEGAFNYDPIDFEG